MSFFGARRCKFLVEPRSGYLDTGDEKTGLAGLPRVDIVFGFKQCDKENHGWREGRR